VTLYRVTGSREYRGHKSGDVFEATLDPAAEARALRRGSIEVVKRSRPRLQEGSYTLPTKTKQKVKGGSTDA
jgi:hypothetical protein